MKKIIFGIFAHPDDEAFGPSGTLLKESRSGSDIHLIMLTAGEAGTNEDDTPNLAQVRLEEWSRAGKLLDAKSMHFLGYKDGQLNNTSMIKIADEIIDIVSTTIKKYPEDSLVEFIGFDLSGISGHIDHIVASRAACLAFYRLKEQDSRLSRVRLMCLPGKLYPTHNTRWLYMEKGRPDSQIDEVVDARELREDIIEVMRTHKTQRVDCEQILSIQGDQLGLNYFVVKD